MSDQYTRITCGGTPLSSTTTPVVGLLFGTYRHYQVDEMDPTSIKDKSGSSVTVQQCNIMDADEIPIDISTSADRAAIQIALHQAVFDQHQVVGWYRVIGNNKNYNNNNDGPTYDDLRITNELKQHYHSTNNNNNIANEKHMRQHPFIFALLQVQEDDNKNDHTDMETRQQQQQQDSKLKSEDTNHERDNDNEEEDEELPLTLYQLSDNNQVLIAIDEESWKLDTSPSEQIAVERVMKEQRPMKQANRSFYYYYDYEGVTSNENQTIAVEDSTTNNKIIIPSSLQVQTNPFIHQTIPIQHSIDMMNQRMKIITQFITQTISHQIPYHPILIRQVYGLILQNHLLSSSSSSSSSSLVSNQMESASSMDQDQKSDTENNTPVSLATVAGSKMPVATTTSRSNDNNNSNTMDLLQHLTLLAKTVDAIQTYTDKMKLIHDTKSSSSNNNEDDHENLGTTMLMMGGGGSGTGGSSNNNYMGKMRGSSNISHFMMNNRE
jgi:hypothetical protein